MSMKNSFILLLFLSASVICAQVKNSGTGQKDTLRANGAKQEKKGVSIVKQNEFLQRNNLIYNPSDAPMVTNFNKLSVKETVLSGQKSEKEYMEENMSSITADVRRVAEDKRPALLKTVQAALGIAQAVVVTALAVREVVREVEQSKKK